MHGNGYRMIITQSQTKVRGDIRDIRDIRCGQITNTFVLNSVFDAYIGG